jgi:hypothetical protein
VILYRAGDQKNSKMKEKGGCPRKEFQEDQRTKQKEQDISERS